MEDGFNLLRRVHYKSTTAGATRPPTRSSGLGFLFRIMRVPCR